MRNLIAMWLISAVTSLMVIGSTPATSRSLDTTPIQAGGSSMKVAQQQLRACQVKCGEDCQTVQEPSGDGRTTVRRTRCIPRHCTRMQTTCS